jgi:hypothetical protein
LRLDFSLELLKALKVSWIELLFVVVVLMESFFLQDWNHFLVFLNFFFGVYLQPLLLLNSEGGKVQL